MSSNVCGSKRVKIVERKGIYCQSMWTVTVMHTGAGVPCSVSGSNSHWRIASVIALLNDGNGGLNSMSRIGHTRTTLPELLTRASPIHMPLPVVPGGH